MSTDKNYLALLSLIYILQSCRIVPMESESDNSERCAVDNTQFFIEVQIFAYTILNEVIRHSPL